MKTLILALCVLSIACATQKYREEKLADGSWNITVKHVNKETMKGEVTARGQLVCASQPFRIVNCEEKMKGPEGFFNAVCLVKCGEKPFLAKEKPLDKKAAGALEKEAKEAPEIQ